MQFESLPINETSLLAEIFTEVFADKEVLILEISSPSFGYEFEVDRELDAIGKKIEECLAKTAIPGIKQNTVKRSKDAEIVMELDYLVAPQVTKNRRRGNKYRDAIGSALMNCPDLFDLVKVEGAPNVNNTITTKKGPRFVDIRLVDKKTKKPVNIEIKRGKSRYHTAQRQKDAAIARQGKGQTYVVRGTPTRKGREINY